ncbi:importin alpha subunit, partial [Caulochytrium protostelioides]
IGAALPVLAKLLYAQDQEILTDACWAISYLSDGTNDKIQAVIESGMCRRLVELLTYEEYSVQTPALRSVGNIVTGDDVQTQTILNCNALYALAQLLSSPKEGIRKEACWTISNITAGNAEQIQAVIDAGLVPQLVHILQNGDFKTKREAAWAISNATSGGLLVPQQVHYLVSVGCLKPLCDLLGCGEARVISVALDGLENILKVGEKEKAATDGYNNMAALIEDAGGMELLGKLQMSDNQDVYSKAYNLIDKYFSDDEDEMAPDVVGPATDAATGQFAFHKDAVDMPQGGFTFGQ